MEEIVLPSVAEASRRRSI